MQGARPVFPKPSPRKALDESPSARGKQSKLLLVQGDDHRPSFRQTCEKIQKHDSHWNLWIWP